jgi:hypothetical protein
MPVSKKVYGEQAAAPGPRQVATLPTTKAASPPLQPGRYARNNKPVDASFMNQMSDQLNQAMLFRTKEAFSWTGDLGSAPGIQATSAAGTRGRYRFAFRTSPYSHALLARVVLFPPSSNYGYDTYSTLKIFSDATESTLISTTEFHFGPGPSNASVGGWQYHRILDRYIEGLSSDTEYFALVNDVDYGRIQSIAVADLQSANTRDGYLPNTFTEQTELLAAYRENLVSAIPDLWKKGGSKVFNWTTNLQSIPQTNATSTLKNVLDGTSTAVSAATPGYTLDFSKKRRLSQTTVPCRFWFCGSWASGGGAVVGGNVSIKDSSGAVIASITDGWNSTTPKWVSVNVNMPAVLGKVDVQFSNGLGGTFSAYAYSMWEYET